MWFFFFLFFFFVRTVAEKSVFLPSFIIAAYLWPLGYLWYLGLQSQFRIHVLEPEVLLFFIRSTVEHEIFNMSEIWITFTSRQSGVWAETVKCLRMEAQKECVKGFLHITYVHACQTNIPGDTATGSVWLCRHLVWIPYEKRMKTHKTIQSKCHDILPRIDLVHYSWGEELILGLNKRQNVCLGEVKAFVHICICCVHGLLKFWLFPVTGRDSLAPRLSVFGPGLMR